MGAEVADAAALGFPVTAVRLARDAAGADAVVVSLSILLGVSLVACLGVLVGVRWWSQLS